MSVKEVVSAATFTLLLLAWNPARVSHLIYYMGRLGTISLTDFWIEIDNERIVRDRDHWLGHNGWIVIIRIHFGKLAAPLTAFFSVVGGSSAPDGFR